MLPGNYVGKSPVDSARSLRTWARPDVLGVCSDSTTALAGEFCLPATAELLDLRAVLPGIGVAIGERVVVPGEFLEDRDPRLGVERVVLETPVDAPRHVLVVDPLQPFRRGPRGGLVRLLVGRQRARALACVELLIVGREFELKLGGRLAPGGRIGTVATIFVNLAEPGLVLLNGGAAVLAGYVNGR